MKVNSPKTGRGRTAFISAVRHVRMLTVGSTTKLFKIQKKIGNV